MKTLQLGVACTVAALSLTASSYAAEQPGLKALPALMVLQGPSDALPALPALPSLSDQPSADGYQVKDDLLAGLESLGANAKERNEVNLDKNMMGLLGGSRGGRYADLAQKMDFIVVRNYEYAKKGDYNRADIDALRRKLEGNGWSHLVRNESEGEINDIVVKPGSDGTISDMVILNAEARELNIVHMRGHFRMEDVNGAMGATIGLSAGTMGMAGALGHTGMNVHVITAPAVPATPMTPEQIEQAQKRAMDRAKALQDRQKQRDADQADRQKQRDQAQKDRDAAQKERDAQRANNPANNN